MGTLRSLAKHARVATLRAFALCTVLLWVNEGRAQGAPRPRVELPAAVSDTRVDYPPGASGDAQVVLELVIGVDGSVERVDVVTGDEPFASTARRAALAWKFRPAKRDDTAVRAKIRFQVVFTEPKPEPEPEPAPGSTPEVPEAPEPMPAPKPAPPEAIEVVVEGERADSSKRMTRAEVRQLPGAFGDPFRAIEVLPGVTPIASGLPYFFVRGAPPGNVGYFFDDIPVPGLYHVAAGPAVIHPAFVDDVRLYSGAFPARYGRFAGAVVAGTAAPPQYRFRGEANLRLIDSGALVEAPFDDARGSVMVAGRYSYTAALVSLIAPEVEVAYWDYQGRVQYRLTDRDTVSVFGFGSYDFLRAEDDDGELRDIYDVTFHRYDLRYDRTLSSKSAVRLATTLAFDRTAAGQRVDLVANRVRNRVHYTDQVSKRVKLQAGADVDIARYSIFLDRDGPDDGAGGLPEELDPRPLPGLPPRQLPRLPNDETLEDLFSSRNEIVTGAWVEGTLGLGAGVTLTPGFRLDAYTGDGVTRLAPEPRISARFQLNPRVALLHDLGIAHQPPSFAIPVPGLNGRASRGLQRGVQTSAGTEIELGAEVTGTFTLFQTAMFGGTDPLSLFQLQRADPTVDNDEDRSIAHTYGLEVMLRRPLSERIGGFASYTLSRSTRSAGRLHGPSSFDRTHVVNLALAYELGRNWRAGWRGVFYSGIPAEVAYPRAARRPPRTDPYYRLDLRLEKRWRLGQTGFWALVFEVLNATLNKETLDRSCYAYGCSDDDIGPITIPSIGLEASF